MSALSPFQARCVELVDAIDELETGAGDIRRVVRAKAALSRDYDPMGLPSETISEDATRDAISIGRAVRS